MSLLEAARSQALTVLASPLVSTKRILLLKERLVNGQFNGKNCRYCFFGILGGESHEGYNSLREDLGMSTTPKLALGNAIEFFSFLIYRGSPLELTYSLILLDWVEFELDNRATMRRPPRTQSTSIPVSVTKSEIDERLDQVAAEELINETRFPAYEEAQVT